MSTVTTRAVKGGPLTWAEADANFNNLNTDKLEINPALGTPVSGTLTNCTGLPVSTGVSGLGTGVATALAVNVGSAGAPVVLNGALGTPSSGVGTNLTGTAAGLTAGNVTTNANLTGHVTSVGNAAVLGSFTLAQLNTAISDGDVPIAATQADQETATSTTTYVSPGRQQYHPSAAKAWVVFDSAVNIAASYNLTSVTDSGVGLWTINWATDFSSAFHCNQVTAEQTVTGAASSLIIQIQDGLAAGTTSIRCVDSTTVTARDPTYVHCVAFGDQA